MGRRLSDNFKKRFGDPPRIEIKYTKKKLSSTEEVYRSSQIATAHAKVLRSILGREPTQNEILGKVDISKQLKKRQNEK